ncbi:hypothetical protein BJ122_10444 [Rhodopseudomonas faecalis]|uniref:Uncharacterized protein n=1 Tax=Rhodopseudomonas faecalis TaxID=99655 RepID=A0A318TH76_9BRAD|nr:hypothetical protein BJ122_10444 [Rhodopseudomonas faecalis]
MPPRLPSLPTLAQFLDEARRIGCKQRFVRGRLVLEHPSGNTSVVVKRMLPTEQLTQFYTEYLSRILGVTKFVGVREPRPNWVPSSDEEN